MQESAALLELQALDVEILRAEKRLEELPEKTAILEVRAKQREIKVMHQKADLLVRKLQAEVKSRSDETSTINEKLAVEQQKVMSTTDHRAVQSITREMDGLRRRVDKLEMESLKYMERIEKAQEQIATIDDALAKFAEKETALVDRFKEVGGALQKEIGQLQARREKLAKSLSPELLMRYETIRASKGGVGVGKLEGDSCTACRMSLPGEKLQELNQGPDIGLCPQCRRLIVVRTGDAA